MTDPTTERPDDRATERPTTEQPLYISEQQVAHETGMSRIWLQRARTEGIGPPFRRIGRRVVYRFAAVLEWIESGQAGKEHLSSPRPTKAG